MMHCAWQVFSLVLFYATIGKLGLFERYRIQPSKAPSAKQIKDLWTQALGDHLVVQWLFIHFALGRLYAAVAGLDELVAPELPSLRTHLWHLLLCVLVEDGAFYWLHRRAPLLSRYNPSLAPRSLPRILHICRPAFQPT